MVTLNKRHPVNVPLEVNSYFEREFQAGTLQGVVQLTLVRDSHGQPSNIAISLVAKSPDVKTRPSGMELSIDFGVRHALFATNKGQLLGQKMTPCLAELDAIVRSYMAKLQKAGIALKSDPYYRQLQKRIRDYVTNEIGRLLNRIAACVILSRRSRPCLDRTRTHGLVCTPFNFSTDDIDSGGTCRWKKRSLALQVRGVSWSQDWLGDRDIEYYVFTYCYRAIYCTLKVMVKSSRAMKDAQTESINH